MVLVRVLVPNYCGELGLHTRFDDMSVEYKIESIPLCIFYVLVSPGILRLTMHREELERFFV